MTADRAEQSQPGGYTPPEVGAPTWPQQPETDEVERLPCGCTTWRCVCGSVVRRFVGAPTWPRSNPGATISERGDRLAIEWPDGRGMSWVAPKVIEGWVEQVNDLRALTAECSCVSWPPEGPLEACPVHGVIRAFNEASVDRDRLRAVIAAAYVDLLAGRVDEALAALRTAGGQP